MTQTIDQMIDDVIRREGGYNEVVGDAGGATNLGVSLRYLSGVGLLRGDLNHDGVINKFDVKLVTPAVAHDLYKLDFFFAPHIDKLPSDLQPVVFDVAVNAGAPRAVMLLQKTLRSLTGQFIAADGVSGPGTCAAAYAAVAKYGIAAVVNGVVAQRLAWYDACVAENPVDAKFLAGWKNRANSFRM